MDTSASQEDRGFDATMEEHNKREVAKVAPTGTGTKNVAALARAKEANLAAKKSPPAAQKPLMWARLPPYYSKWQGVL